jgi:non-lysosomal glucosylceramidase
MSNSNAIYQSTRPRPNEIPEAAWARPIGLPFNDSGHPTATYPMIDDGPYNGAPIGGMGAGSIGRTFRGDFARWHLNVGAHEYQTLPANMFSVYMQQGDQQVAQALYTGRPSGDQLSAWTWDYPVGAGTYYALYPRSWFVYDNEQFPVQLSVEQYSPVIPNNYQESSYPVGLFNWTATNPSDAPVTVAVMFTWQNLITPSFNARTSPGQINQMQEIQTDDGAVRGVVLSRSDMDPTNEYSGTMAIAALETPGVSVSYRSRFLANGDGADIWNDFAADGALDNVDDSTESGSGESLGAGVAVTFTLEPGQTLQVPFALAWDMPVMTFRNQNGGDVTSWYKRYTAFYGREGNHAFEIARDALAQRDDWREQITDWQQPILDDAERPTWYKTALFNELYFLADGATAWEHGQVDEPEPAADEIGGFLYIECFDYPFYSTFDVDFYASFALLELFPELERRVLVDFAHTVPDDDPRTRQIQASGEIARRKVSGAVPHDLGSPDENPWIDTNSYLYQNVNRWKDLNAKFVLRLYRDALLLDDPSLITDHWDAVTLAMDYLGAMDGDGDGIPENEGIPDQTYDTWPATGVSAYSGSLWLAALAASREMAQTVGDTTAYNAYDAQLQRATAIYEDTLWNGTYYDYDASANPYYDSIMSDQLAGQWYGDFLGLSLLPDDHVESALRTIYAFNVQQYGDGQMGAVNGMRPDGQIDTSDLQSQEMWTGTTYGVASFMLMRGLDDEAWGTAYGVYHVTYETLGYWFRTPEAIDINGNFRASLYQRPLSIWAMETALRLRDDNAS